MLVEAAQRRADPGALESPSVCLPTVTEDVESRRQHMCGRYAGQVAGK
jgi:hypothetical protein